MRELNIDWAALHSAFQMNMPEVRCFLCLEDGRVLKLPPGDALLATVRSEPHRFVLIDAIPSRIQYQWLDDFIKVIEDEPIKGRMEAAINGKGAFRRFKDILLTLPDERRRWFEYRDQMMRQRIVDWVREQAISPVNPPPWSVEVGGVGQATGVIAMAPAAAPMPMPMPMPEVSGNVSVRPSAPLSQGNNSRQEVDALRDFLIEWSDNHNPEAMTTPIELEQLAVEIARRFQVKQP